MNSLKEMVVHGFLKLFVETQKKQMKINEALRNDIAQNKLGILRYYKEENSVSQAIELFVQESKYECETANIINFLIFLLQNEKIEYTHVGVGSLFATQNITTDEIDYYLVLPQHGGDIIEIGGKTITAISDGSTVFQNSRGKEKGEKFVTKETEFAIVEIY